ncbi:MAG: sigma 54-interacting transcriptional regulator [bacterium]
MPSSPQWRTEPTGLLREARDIRRLSLEQWGDRKVTTVIGQHASIRIALERVARIAPADGPTILTGETGTGKELFARALYLLSARRGKPFISVNCAQYHDSQLIASELFGHRRGSFTGAVGDHRGVFEAAAGGVVFLDEVGELTLGAQSMLLRVLSESEIIPVGDTAARAVDVRVIAATSRDLPSMVVAGAFRSDLYYRLRHMHIHVPAVRERGDDWELIAADQLQRLVATTGRRKQLADDAVALMSDYPWPGNVRELKSVVDTGFHMADGDMIDASVFAQELESVSRTAQLQRVPMADGRRDPLLRMFEDEESFWDVVHRPYLNRELSRAEVKAILEQGLQRSRGSYRRLLALFRIDSADYLKFMDFLRHQRLKPE